MIFAKNNVQVGTKYDSPYLLAVDFVAVKIDINVRVSHPLKEDSDFGPVYVQTTESEQQAFNGPDAVDTEQLLDVGFHSRTFVTPFTAFRFRAYGPLEALVDFVVYS